jgi:hypothetical protein
MTRQNIQIILKNTYMLLQDVESMQFSVEILVTTIISAEPFEFKVYNYPF